MLDQGSFTAKHKAALEDRLARLRVRIDELRLNPARAPALRASEIERDHLERELKGLRD